MEKRTDLLRSESQSYIISSLNHQIELMLPIRHSYSNLQHYHIKICQDLEILLQEHKQISGIFVERLRQQNAACAQLQNNRAALEGQTRACNKEEVKLSMDHNSLLSSIESLTSKLELEKEQALVLICRSRELQEQIRKNFNGIATLENLLCQLESEIKQKSLQCEDLGNQILKRKQLNHHLSNRNSDVENKLKKMGDKNMDLSESNRKLDCQIDSLNCSVQKQERTNWKQNQNIIQRTQQLQNLNNETEYYSKMLTGEEHSSSILLNNIQRLEKLISSRRNDLETVSSQNNQLSRQISTQKLLFQQNFSSKELASAHLAMIMEMNTLILEAMEKWCFQDRNTIKVIQSKADRLNFIINQTRTVLIGRQVLSNVQNRSRITHSPTAKFQDFNRSGKSWMSTKISEWNVNFQNHI